MKHSKLYIGLAACSALTMGLTGCSQDEISMENTQPIVTEETSKSYVTVNIASPKGGFNGRAMGDNGDNFDNGYASEGAISNVLLVFYDASGRAVISSPLTLGDKTDQTGDPSVETIYSAKVELSLAVGTNMPTQVVAFVNPQKESDQLVSLSELEGLFRKDWVKSVTSGGVITKYFTMNNSVYYKNGVKTYASPLESNVSGEKNQFEATIYVERLAAKVEVAKAATENFVQPVEVGTQKLTFVPEKWALTATENETYLIKNMPAAAPDASTLPWTYNDDVNFRSYWAVSKHYDEASNFPMSGCDVEDPANEYHLHYLSYNEVNSLGIQFGNTGEGNQMYCMENTGRGSKWNNTGSSYNQYATATSVLITGHYEVTDADGTTADFGTDGFYIYNNRASNKADLIAAMAGGQDRVTDADGNAITDYSKFTVAHIHKYSRLGDTKVPSDRVALQLGSDLSGLYYKKDADSDPVAIADANKDEVNTWLAEYANSLATHFVGSKGFFYVPIEHVGLQNNEVITGTYGVVRNHFYRMTINKISTLANGIHELTDPLLPNPIPSETKSVDITFNVNAWHIMSQGVDL